MDTLKEKFPNIVDMIVVDGKIVICNLLATSGELQQLANWIQNNLNKKVEINFEANILKVSDLTSK